MARLLYEGATEGFLAVLTQNYCKLAILYVKV
jgi:hypothetical protein